MHNKVGYTWPGQRLARAQPSVDGDSICCGIEGGCSVSSAGKTCRVTAVYCQALVWAFGVHRDTACRSCPALLVSVMGTS